MTMMSGSTGRVIVQDFYTDLSSCSLSYFLPDTLCKQTGSCYQQPLSLPIFVPKKKANSYITDDEDMLAHVQLQEQELNFPKDALSLVMAQVLW